MTISSEVRKAGREADELHGVVRARVEPDDLTGLHAVERRDRFEIGGAVSLVAHRDHDFP